MKLSAEGILKERKKEKNPELNHFFLLLFLELSRSAATEVKLSGGGKELPLRRRKLSILKNSALKRKVSIRQDDQTWKKGDRAKKVEESVGFGKKVLSVKKTESRSALHAISEATGLETNSSLTQARNRYEPEGMSEIQVKGKKISLSVNLQNFYFQLDLLNVRYKEAY